MGQGETKRKWEVVTERKTTAFQVGYQPYTTTTRHTFVVEAEHQELKDGALYFYDMVKPPHSVGTFEQTVRIIAPGQWLECWPVEEPADKGIDVSKITLRLLSDAFKYELGYRPDFEDPYEAVKEIVRRTRGTIKFNTGPLPVTLPVKSDE